MILYFYYRGVIWELKLFRRLPFWFPLLYEAIEQESVNEREITGFDSDLLRTMKESSEYYYEILSKNVRVSLFTFTINRLATLVITRGHSHYGGDADVRLQRPPFFQCCPWLSLLSPKDPTFLVKCGLFADRSHPKTTYFFACGCHRKLLFVSISSTNWSFLPFSTFFFCFVLFCFFQFPAFKALTERSKVIHSHPMPPNFEPKFGFSTNDPSFFEIVFSPNPPAFGSMSLTPVSIWYIGVPPPPSDNHSDWQRAKLIWSFYFKNVTNTVETTETLLYLIFNHKLYN